MASLTETYGQTSQIYMAVDIFLCCPFNIIKFQRYLSVSERKWAESNGHQTQWLGSKRTTHILHAQGSICLLFLKQQPCALLSKPPLKWTFKSSLWQGGMCVCGWWRQLSEAATTGSIEVAGQQLSCGFPPWRGKHAIGWGADGQPIAAQGLMGGGGWSQLKGSSFPW